jgi:hypothetical protein
MDHRKKITTRRNEMRFQVQKGALAVQNGQARIMGQILDISRNGLAFHYIDDGKKSNGSYDVDILLTKKGFYLKKIQSKIILDFEMTNQVPFSSITMRRRSVKFGELMGEQISQLEYFIQNHTIDEVKDRRCGVDSRQNNDPQYKDYEEK